MQVKRLLCISSSASAWRDRFGALNGWEVCTASDLESAARILLTQRFVVGLLLDFVDRQCVVELDHFLRRHGHLQWVGTFDARVLESSACRDLVTDHLCDFHTSPIDPLRLAYTLGHAHGWAMLRDRAHLLSRPDGLNRINGECEAVTRLRAQIRKVALVNAPVLIWGESGSGKELTAQAIHELSPRARGPFVPINCGAMPANLIQSELFGHQRGAFTGASKDKAGLIESAAGGTIFLDEIGDLPMDLQSNLLRFLQEGTIYRVGATRSMVVDARVIAASHVNLQDAVSRGAFREDLYYRLNVLPIVVPPLRERKDDLPALTEHFFRVYSADKGAHVRGFSSKALAAIAQHDWPGNVRELINRIRRAMVLADGHLISPEDLGLAGVTVISGAKTLEDSREHAERLVICESLGKAGKNITHAARQLGVSRMTLYRLLAKHHIAL